MKNDNQTVRRPEPAWIPVNRELPPNDDFVLAVVNGRYQSDSQNVTFENAMVIANYYADSNEWDLEGYPEHDSEQLTVSFWMPLPDPPEKVDMSEKQDAIPDKDTYVLDTSCIMRKQAIDLISRMASQTVKKVGLENSQTGKAYLLSTQHAVDYLKTMPDANVRPVVRAKWIHKPGHDGEWLCGQCKHDLEYIDGRVMGFPNFCPNCGAYMRSTALLEEAAQYADCGAMAPAT